MVDRSEFAHYTHPTFRLSVSANPCLETQASIRRNIFFWEKCPFKCAMEIRVIQEWLAGGLVSLSINRFRRQTQAFVCALMAPTVTNACSIINGKRNCVDRLLRWFRGSGRWTGLAKKRALFIHGLYIRGSSQPYWLENVNPTTGGSPIDP